MSEDRQTETGRALGLLNAYFRNDGSTLHELVTDLINDRLQWRERAHKADQKLCAIRAHIVDSPHYVSAETLRQQLLDLLDADAVVYPTLMTRVGREGT